jgi:Protein of unknown function (DUF1064).
MSARFTSSDLSRLGDSARRQIAAADIAREIQAEMKRGNKYGAKRCCLDDLKFDSQGERDRYAALKLEERGGLIRNLEVHPVYELVVNGVRVGKFTPDFRYFRGNAVVVEDFKSPATVKTKDYQLRKRLTEALYPGTKITEVMK